MLTKPKETPAIRRLRLQWRAGGDTTGANNDKWTATGSGANPASATDFRGGTLPSGTLSFTAGQPSKDITVNVSGDTIVEPDSKSFSLFERGI
jgi:hypothetical protein